MLFKLIFLFFGRPNFKKWKDKPLSGGKIMAKFLSDENVSYIKNTYSPVIQRQRPFLSGQKIWTDYFTKKDISAWEHV